MAVAVVVTGSLRIKKDKQVRQKYKNVHPKQYLTENRSSSSFIEYLPNRVNYIKRAKSESPLPDSPSFSVL
uniref:Uncharacterized protein n=1 Tax=Romanomermis culicivorax TaxID=13658 RepID=A0A915HKE9_ROMCU